MTTHGWPSGQGSHHGDPCQFMKYRPSEFTPAMLAARTPDAVPNHPGSTNVQRANVPTSSHCFPCTYPLISECPSPPTLPLLPLVIRPSPISRFLTPPPTLPGTKDSLRSPTTLSSCRPLHHFQHHFPPPSHRVSSTPYCPPSQSYHPFFPPKSIRQVGI